MNIFNISVHCIESALVRAGYPLMTKISDMESMSSMDFKSLLRRGNRLGTTPIAHGDDKFLRMIIVNVDITAPRYWWQEFDTYHFTTKMSQSTMHRLTKMDIREMVNPYVDERIIQIMESLIAKYKENPTKENFMKMKSNLPEGFELTAAITTNYSQLKTMYYQRKNHRLPEWKEFCLWIKSLPFTRELGVVDDKPNTTMEEILKDAVQEFEQRKKSGKE